MFAIVPGSKEEDKSVGAEALTKSAIEEMKKEAALHPPLEITPEEIEVAKKLLGENTFSVAETAEKCGFRDAGYFITVFRRKTGISPGAFRRKNAAEQ